MTYDEAFSAIDIRAYENNPVIRRWRMDFARYMERESYHEAAHFYLLFKDLQHAQIDPRIPALLMLEGELE